VDLFISNFTRDITFARKAPTGADCFPDFSFSKNQEIIFSVLSVRSSDWRERARKNELLTDF
jgi:hypothetical protein